jgi:hypothetical protein
MYLNQFSVRIPEGSEVSDGYVSMKHGTQYSLVLKNDRDVRCDAKVEIDGKDMGTYRIQAGDSARLERSSYDNGRFTFYRAESREGQSIGLDKGNPNLGLVKVTFTPEMASYRDGGVAKGAMFNSPIQDFSGSRGMSAGGTGLSGWSNQEFTSAQNLQLDYEQQTIIHLRLGASNDLSTPRPLVSKSNPVPPPLNNYF